MTEREFIFTYDIEYTVTIPWTKTFQISAESLADAKRQAADECDEAERGDYFQGDIGYSIHGCTVESADVEMDSLTDEETGDIYESLAIEEEDETPFEEDEA